MAECRTNVPGGYCAVHGRGLQVGADGLCIVGREARSPDVVAFARVCAQLAQVPKEVRDFIGRDVAETVDVPPSVGDLLECLAEEWLRAAPPRAVDRDAAWSLISLLRRVWARGYGYGVCVEVESDRRASNAATLYEHSEARADAAEAKLRLVLSAAKDLEMDASRLSTNLHKLRG